MMDHYSSPASDSVSAISLPTQQGHSLTLFDNVRAKLTAYAIRFKPIFLDIRKLGCWLEFEGADLAKVDGESELLFELAGDGSLQTLRIGPRKHDHPFDQNQDQALWKFFVSHGIIRIRFDSRLERNQVEDVLVFLYSQRHKLTCFRQGGSPSGIAAHLVGKEGVHLACTHTQLTGDTLEISYSYCVLGYSRLVRWFEQKNQDFRDHRVLFSSGPKFAFLIGLITTAPGLIHGVNYGNWTIFGVSLIESLIIMPIIYLFFMVVGSIEYDNEEKTFHLTKAYSQLKGYTDRIQADIQRARAVQEKILPDLSSMPLTNKIDWCSCYRPEEQVGGDYFDAHVLPGNRVAILFCDVSGHGLAAAFITAIVKTTFQAWIDKPGELTELMIQLNGTLCRLIPDESFAAIFVAVYDTSTREISYINGGHSPEPWLLPANSTRPIVSLCNARSLLLGIEEKVAFNIAQQTLEPGDRILFVSDGIMETHNIDREMYTIEEFEEFLQQSRFQEFSLIARSILAEVDRFSQGAPQGDDQTVLAFRTRA